MRTNLENLRARDETFACIALMEPQHFVVLYDVQDGEAHIVDPPRSYALPIDTFQQSWTGNALLIGPSPFATEELITRWRSRVAWAWRAGVAAAVIVLLAVLGRIANAWLRKGARPVVATSLALLAGALTLVGCQPPGPTGIGRGDVDRSPRPAGLVIEPTEHLLGEVMRPDSALIAHGPSRGDERP